MLIIYDIFLNLFMAVIIEAYERMALMAEWKVSPQVCMSEGCGGGEKGREWADLLGRGTEDFGTEAHLP